MEVNLQSPYLRVQLLLMAKAVSMQTMGIKTTGEKQIALDQLHESILLRTMTQLCAQVGTPSNYLIVKKIYSHPFLKVQLLLMANAVSMQTMGIEIA
jgi:hypothetical protein